ncbi:FAD synthetase 1, chloroplastic [Porphyridium purpureum]|uniref:FAD synthase n=1 Tax=Porphyridium purpureum TaxID=35688 RepID=A0A5J4Z1K1_PORPP|nr:FAD synthetase 1, chloroplastic [Porphyridium purpureum]|eukprot:POR6274..scf208_2
MAFIGAGVGSLRTRSDVCEHPRPCRRRGRAKPYVCSSRSLSGAQEQFRQQQGDGAATARSRAILNSTHSPAVEPWILMPGKFDALHLGHFQLLQSACRLGTPVLLTFSGMGKVLGWDPRRRPMLWEAERNDILAEWGRKLGKDIRCETLPFDDIRSLSPEQFIDQVIVERFHASGVVCGYDWRFGFKAQGSADTLCELAKPRGLQVDVIEKIRMHELEVSSTRVRELLETYGDVREAKALLGRYYRLRGRVVAPSDSIHLLNQWSGSQVHVDGSKGLILTDIVNFFPRAGRYETCITFDGRTAPLWGAARLCRSALDEQQDRRNMDLIILEDAQHLWREDMGCATVELRNWIEP